jgi:hypothetical protein
MSLSKGRGEDMFFRWKRTGVTVGLLIFIVALVACGKTVTTGVGAAPATGTATSAPTATATPAPATTPGSTAATGCPAPTQHVTWPGSAPMRLSPKQSDAVTVHVGQTLEIVLPFGHKWDMTQSPVAGILRMDTPAGYGDTSLQGCVWHFTALQAGQTNADFTLGPLCAKGMKCPQYIAVLDITITVAG